MFSILHDLVEFDPMETEAWNVMLHISSVMKKKKRRASRKLCFETIVGSDSQLKYPSEKEDIFFLRYI